MAEDSRTRKPGKVSLYPLKFEDALRGLLKSKPRQSVDEHEREATIADWSEESQGHEDARE